MLFCSDFGGSNVQNHDHDQEFSTAGELSAPGEAVSPGEGGLIPSHLKNPAKYVA